jgi:hypothetical protein
MQDLNCCGKVFLFLLVQLQSELQEDHGSKRGPSTKYCVEQHGHSVLFTFEAIALGDMQLSGVGIPGSTLDYLKE